MWHLLKRDFWNHWPFILFAFLFILALYTLGLKTPTGFWFINLLIVLFATIFYSDHKNSVNRFLISLPIQKRNIILSRFIYICLISTLFLLFVWLVDVLYQLQQINWVTFLISFTLLSIIIAISFPIYYAISTFWVAVFTQFVFLLIGSLLFTFIMDSPYIRFDTLHIIGFP